MVAVIAWSNLASAQFNIQLPVDAKKSKWLAFGDMRGYFEPCGCDPSADLGGVLRLSAFTQREQSLNPEAELFSVGNNLATSDDVPQYKSSFVLDALLAIKPSVYLYNQLEQAAGAALKPKIYKLPLLLSNASKKSSTYGYVKVFRSIAVMGYVTPSKSKIAARAVDSSLIAEWTKELAKQKKDRLLLFSGDEKELAFFVESKIFDTIVRSNPQPMSAIVGPEERDNEKSLRQELAKTDVYIAPLGGQGVIRGGSMAQSEAPLLQDILSNKSLAGTSSEPKYFSWLDVRYRDIDVRLVGLNKKYQQAAQDVFASNSQKRVADLKNSIFAGAETCKACHVKAYEVWATSKHASALATLEAKSKDKDPECVGCHVLGYDEKGGFVSKQLSPNFANVQCENCHGAAKEHANNPSEAKPLVKHSTQNSFVASKDTCKNCHVGAHSPNFDYAKYWDKIKH